MLLCLCMVVGLLPVGYLSLTPAQAASNVDGGLEGQEADIFTDLGFDTSVEPEGYDALSVDNPYGRKKLAGNQIFEMLISNAGGTNPAGKNDNTLGVSNVVQGSRNSVKVPLQMFATAAADFDGDGLPGEAIYVGVEPFDVSAESSQSLPLKIVPFDGKTETFGEVATVGSVKAISYEKNSYYHPGLEQDITNIVSSGYDYQIQNYLQITAGDYDGDGYAEIAVYIPDHGNARVDILKWMRDKNSKADDWKSLSNWSVVWSHVLSNSHVPNMVSLLSSDINRDGIDDLGISQGVLKEQGEYPSIYFTHFGAYGTSATILLGSRTEMLRQSMELNVDKDHQTRVSLTAGDINADGYDELVVTSQPIEDIGYNTTRNIIIYTYDGTGSLAELYSGSLKPVQGRYEYTEKTEDGKTSYVKNWISDNGFDDSYRSSQAMRTNAAVVKFKGYDYPFLYLDSCLYEYVEGSLTLKMSLDDPSYDGSNQANTTWLNASTYVEFGAVAADINGEGYDQLYTSYYTEQSSAEYSYMSALPIPGALNQKHFGGIGGLEGKGNGSLHFSTYSDSKYSIQDADNFPTGPEKPCCYVATPLDMDYDTTIIEYTGLHYLKYSDPKVMAVIAAAPYFEDVDVISGYDYAWQNTTSWSTISGEGHGDLVSVDLEAGAFYSSEKVLAVFMTSLETSVNFTMEWEKVTSKTTEYTLTFETSQDEDSVAFYSIPAENYVYLIHTPDGNGGYNPPQEKTISRTFEPVYQVLTLDYYETIRQKHKDVLPELRGKVLTSTPGDPSSYPSDSSGYDVIAKWNSDAAGVSFGNGAITQEITITEEESESYNLGCALDFQIGFGGHSETLTGLSGFEAQGGLQFSMNPGGGWTDLTLSGTTISGTVTNMPLEFQEYGYYYSWKLFSYAYEFNGSRIPVVSYLVNDVAQPPLLPGDFQQDVERTTSDKNVLTWSYEGAYSSFIIHKYFDFPIGGGLQKIAEYEAGEAPFVIKYDKEGKPYKEFYFEDTNLAPYSEYQYAIQVKRISEVPPVSAPSALITARTRAAVGNPNSIMVESDGDNDGKLLVYPDRTGHLTAEVRGPDGEAGYDYYSTIQYQWQKKEDGAWTDLENKTGETIAFSSSGKEIEGQYRCRINVLTKKDNTAISAYSAVVEVEHSYRSSLIEDVYVRTVKGGTEFYVKVGNAHVDSGAVPSGTVRFALRHVQSREVFYHDGTLDAAGTYQSIKTGVYPAGTYEVLVSYSSSSIFNACSGECVYLSQVDEGYTIDVPNSVTYGEGTEIVFNRISSINGFAVKTPVDPNKMYLLYEDVKQTVDSTEVIRDETVEGYTRVWDNEPVRKGEKYAYCFHRSVKVSITEGEISFYHFMLFTASHDGFFSSGLLARTPTIRPYAPDTYLRKDEAPGVCTLLDHTPAGGYTIRCDGSGDAVIYTSVSVAPLTLTLQLPTLTQKQDSGVSMGDITYGQLDIVSGSWAKCDSDENGSITGAIASSSVAPSYINTAGTAYNKDSKLATCGHYVISAKDTLDNYQVTYRSGSMSVIGGNKPMTFGVRPFEDKDVGFLYMVSPDYAYTREEKGLTLNQAVGSRVIFTAVPDEGYQIYDWYVNGVAQGITDSRFAYEMQNQNTTVEVQFVFRPDTLIFGKAGATEGGTLTCSDAALNSGSIVIPNTYLTYTATAKEGYHFKEWRYSELGRGTAYYTEDDGKMSSTFELLMPAVSCSLYAVFEADGYALTYEDKNGLEGLTAWYWGNPSGDATAALEKVTVQSGDVVPGGAQVVVQPREGYRLDQEYNFVSIGSQGVANYSAETYTFTITEDTHVTGYTLQSSFTVKVNLNVSYQYAFCQGAAVTLSIDGEEHECKYTPDASAKVLEDIPGGSKVSVTISYPDYYVFEGWQVNDTLHTGTTYTLAELGEDVTFTPMLKEKPVHKVTLTDISDRGTYSVTLSEGSGQEGNVVTCHENDPLTIQVTPKTGYTVTYWNVKAASSTDSWETKASSLRYQFPKLTADYTFTPIFSSTTYHSVTWPTIRYYGVTLTPQEGCLTTVASGKSFSFILSGGLGAYSDVYANGLVFKASSTAGADYPHVYETKDGTRVYTIHNITDNQVISVSSDSVTNTLTAVADSSTAHLGQTVKVTLSYTGTPPTHYTCNSNTATNNGDGTFDIYIPKDYPNNVTCTYIMTSYYGSTKLAETEIKINVPSGYVSSISITTEDLTPGEDGSYLISPITASGEAQSYDFNALVTLLAGAGGRYSSTEVSWSLWGTQSRSTSVNADGVLTVSPKEKGTDGQIKLIATYHYPDGDSESRDVVIRLSDSSYVATRVSDQRGGTVSQVGYVTAGETVTITAAVQEKYYINGWYINDVLVADEVDDTLTFTAEAHTYYTVTVEFGHDFLDEDGDHLCDLCGEYEEAQLVTEENREELGLEERYIGSYAIANMSQMFWFAGQVNSGSAGISGVLLADIDLENQPWTPMGTWNEAVNPQINQAFTGTFDGRGHVIKNLNVHVTDGQEAGLFGRTQGATVKHFGVINAVVISDPVKNTGYRAGVIAGEMHQSTVENLFSAGQLTITTQHKQRGGIAGECADSIVTGCYTTLGALTDGAAAQPDSLTNCFFVMSDDYAFSLGEAKDMEQLASGEVTWLLNGESNEGVWKQTIGTDALPGFTGQKVYYYNTCKGEGFTNDLNVAQSHSFDKDGFCTNPISEDQICGAYQNAVLNDQGIYEISNAGQLYWFAGLVNGTLPYGTAQNTLASGMLMEDIQIGQRSWTPIGSTTDFAGTFDGNGHTVDLGEQTVTTDFFGIVGKTQAAAIQNLTVTGSITVDASVDYVSGIVGYGYGGSVTGCISYVDITVTQNGTGSRKIAGIVGGSQAGITISGCANHGDILADGAEECVAGITGYANEYVTIYDCGNYGNVSGNGVNYVAGILGYVNNDAFRGVYDCLNVGSVTCDKEHCGDIIGWAKDYAHETILNNYYTGAKAFGVDSQSGKTALAEQVNADRLASGEITWLLNNESPEGLWKQTLPAAVLPGFTGEAVHYFTDCAEKSGYTNDVDQAWVHLWIDATCTEPKTCTVCGAVDGTALRHSYSSSVLTQAPTCGTQGVKTFTCDRCGDTHTELVPATADHRDENKNGRCDVCNCLMQPAMQRMASISLKGDIAINYYLLLTDEVLADETAYMQFTMADGEIIKIPVSQGVKRVRNGEVFYTFSCSVNAKEMTDTVRSRFFYAGGSTPEYTYSVQTYAKNMLAKSDDEALKTLVTAMLHYGAAAQTYFGYNTSNLANAGLSAEDYSGMTIEGFNPPTGNGTDLVKVYSATVLMESETTLRFYLKVDSSVERFSVTCNGTKLWPKYSGDLCYVEVRGIVAKDLDAYVTITISDGTKSANVTYNPMTYCSSVVNNTSGAFSQEMKNLACALYRYSQAAKAYLAAQESA